MKRLSRITVRLLSPAAVTAAVLATAAFALAAGDLSPEVQRIHRDAVVCDLHADTHFLITYENFDITKAHHTVPWGPAGVAAPFSDIDVPRLKKGGVDLFSIAICPTPKNNKLPGSAAFVRRSLNALDRVFALHSDVLARARTAREAREIIASGRIAVLQGVEGGQGIENNLDILREFHDRGVRYLTLTHTKNLDWAESASDKPADFDGLTGFGREVVHEMERLHMIIDLAHTSERTFWATYHATTGPIFVTHAAARGIADHPRNLSDDQLRAVAERGGVVGVIFYPKYLDPSGTKPVNVGLIADHIDYIKKVAGIDVIALGSDFDGNVTMPPDLSDCSMLPNLTAELVRRGYTEEEIDKVMGGNFLRAWERLDP